MNLLATARREPERLFAYLFVAPAVLLFLTFRLYPLIIGAQYSFTDWDGVTAPIFVGFRNYIELFTIDDTFRASMVNTVIMVATLPIWVLLPLVLAALIHFGVPFGGFYRVAYFFPLVLSSVIIATMFGMILRYDGVLNQVLEVFGAAPVDWLGGKNTALLCVIFVAIWAHFGMSVLIYLSGLATVPPEVVDAAKIDGANLRQVIFLVVMPMMLPIVQFITVTSTITILTSLFGLIYVMTGGGPGTATYMPEYLIWLKQGESNRLGYASAMSMILLLFVAVVGVVQIKVMNRQ